MAKPDRISFEASRLFARFGFEGVSMRQVAEASGVTTAALYYHFPSKEDLHEEIIESSFDDFIGQINCRWNSMPEAMKRPSTMAMLIFDAVAADSTFFLLIQQELHAFSDDARRTAAQKRQSKILKLLSRVLEHARNQPPEETEVVTLAAMITGYCEVIYPDRRFSDANNETFLNKYRNALTHQVARLFEDRYSTLTQAS